MSQIKKNKVGTSIKLPVEVREMLDELAEAHLRTRSAQVEALVLEAYRREREY